MNTEGNKPCGTGCQGINWWATLVVAVLAVPSFGIIASSIIPVKGFEGVAVFIIACWLCTYLGMRLMHNPKMHEKINLTNKSE